ncbi:DNA helicase [Tanacetum coccineum]
MQQFLGLTPAGRADIVARVFEQKVQDFCRFLKERQPFGSVAGLLYTIEFQKRRLPHCHTLLWVEPKDKIQHAVDVDQYISAELPDPESDPQGYRVISEMMVHGPYGPFDSGAVCMKEGKCGRKFPKKYVEDTFFNADGYVHYHSKSWHQQKKKTTCSIGRLANVHPASGELFYLRMLLSYEALGLLGDDKEWQTALEEAAFSATRQQLRMSDDIPRTVLDSLHIEDLYMNDPELEGGVLCELEVILNTFSKTVSDYSLHPLLKKHRDTLRNRELMEEKSYNRVELAKEVAVF